MKYKFENVRAIQQARISPDDIILIRAELNYSVLHLLNGRKLTLAKTLLECEIMLRPYDFIRPNRSVIINLNQIDEVLPYAISLSNKDIISISRRRAIVVKELINQTAVA